MLRLESGLVRQTRGKHDLASIVSIGAQVRFLNGTFQSTAGTYLGAASFIVARPAARNS